MLVYGKYECFVMQMLYVLSVSFCLPHPVALICSGLCACTEML